jgi:hypothetical protein
VSGTERENADLRQYMADTQQAIEQAQAEREELRKEPRVPGSWR